MSMRGAKTLAAAAALGRDRRAADWIWRVFEITALLVVGVPILVLDALWEAIVRGGRD